MKKLFYILFCLVLWGCQDQEVKRPDDLIPESKMVSILADIHTAEAQVENSIAYPDTALMVFSKLQQDIWKKHNVTEQEFRKTYDFYTKHVPEMDKLYTIVTDTLLARESNYVSKKPEPFIDPELDDSRLDSAEFREVIKSVEGAESFKRNF